MDADQSAGFGADSISRRRFVRGAAATGASSMLALALAGCGGAGGTAARPAPTPTPTPTATPVPTRQALANQPPEAVLLALLLTDGTVMAQAEPTAHSAADFFRLTPDANGSYLAGRWSRMSSPPTGYAPYAGAQAVLADGRALFVGGEYNQDNYGIPFAPSGLTNMSAVYDPVADSWRMIAPPPGMPYIGDVPSAVLTDGRFIFGSKLDKTLWALDPETLLWSPLVSTGKNDNFAEEGFTLLPSGSILVVDMVNVPQTEHYLPGTGAWIQDGPTPQSLASPTDYPAGIAYGPAPVQVVGGVTYGPGPRGVYAAPGEMGPAILRPDGSVFAAGSAVSGAAGHTAIYRLGATPGVAGSWTAGPDFPVGDNAGDSSAVLLISGNVLVAGVSGALYEFDGTTLTRTFAAPSGGGSSEFSTLMLPLPTGQVLVLQPGVLPSASIYTPLGSAQAGWAPTILTAPGAVLRGQTYPLSGTQLNGLSQAAAYGDEFANATNYPLVRITNNASGHVFYARTHGHSSMGVATGALVVSTNFDVPAATETGAASLVVVANGIASAGVAVMVG